MICQNKPQVDLINIAIDESGWDNSLKILCNGLMTNVSDFPEKYVRRIYFHAYKAIVFKSILKGRNVWKLM